MSTQAVLQGTDAPHSWREVVIQQDHESEERRNGSNTNHVRNVDHVHASKYCSDMGRMIVFFCPANFRNSLIVATPRELETGMEHVLVDENGTE